jgi:hypothetical protein
MSAVAGRHEDADEFLRKMIENTPVCSLSRHLPLPVHQLLAKVLQNDDAYSDGKTDEIKMYKRPRCVTIVLYLPTSADRAIARCCRAISLAFKQVETMVCTQCIKHSSGSIRSKIDKASAIHVPLSSSRDRHSLELMALLDDYFATEVLQGDNAVECNV